MAWSAPMTAINGDPFTASQFNQYVRDNLLETVPAKASAAGQYPVSTAANAIAMRTPATATVATQEDTTSLVYAALATPGPAVTVTTGTSALVFITAMIAGPTAGVPAGAAFAISGATTRASNDATGLRFEQDTNEFCRATAVSLETGLTAGSNTFTMQYKSISAGTTRYRDRNIIVFPL